MDKISGSNILVIFFPSLIRIQFLFMFYLFWKQIYEELSARSINDKLNRRLWSLMILILLYLSDLIRSRQCNRFHAHLNHGQYQLSIFSPAIRIPLDGAMKLRVDKITTGLGVSVEKDFYGDEFEIPADVLINDHKTFHPDSVNNYSVSTHI